MASTEYPIRRDERRIVYVESPLDWPVTQVPLDNSPEDGADTGSNSHSE